MRLTLNEYKVVRGRSAIMSVSEYLYWSGPLQALIIAIIGVLTLVIIGVWIWAVDIRGRGIASQ